ncbi:MAG: hypothetical protein JWN76_1973 [Chitinophagaceae bacterium]|nr:hypothetical protein [Chitinophagaceae bacterium]
MRTHAKLVSERIKCRKKFLFYFPKGFYDQQYIDWERGYKWNAHLEWNALLDKKQYESLLAEGKYNDIAQRAVRLETRTNLLFSFEKMALRDAVKTSAGAKNFATGLYEYVYGKASLKQRFENFSEILSTLPVVQTRVHTWPLQTVFGFLGNPEEHIFLKPRVTQRAAEAYDFVFEYTSKPNWKTYSSMIAFAEQVKNDMIDLKPRDYIDLQSFIWVMGSDEYPD